MKTQHRKLHFVNSRPFASLGAIALAISSVAACDVPPEGAVPIESSEKAFIQTSLVAPAVGRNNSDGRLLFAYTVDNNGQRDIMGRMMTASGSAVGPAFVIANTNLDESAPAVAGGSGKFIVTYTTTFSGTDTDPQGAIVDSATGVVPSRFSLDTSFETLHSEARCVVLSTTTFHCVYHSESELFSLDLNSSAAITNRQTIATRRFIQSPSLAFSSLAGRFIVAWNSMFTEDIEIATRAASSNVWETPSRSTWPKEVCSETNCINSGDRVSVAWNVLTRKFGVAIGNDLGFGGRVEAFILPDTCSSTSCAAIRSRICASPTGCTETFRLAENSNLGDVAIASSNRNFAIGYVFGSTDSDDSSLSIVGMNETGLRLQTSAVAAQPSAVRNPLIMSGSMVGTGTQAILGFRLTMDSVPMTPVHMAMVNSQGAVTGAVGVAP